MAPAPTDPRNARALAAGSTSSGQTAAEAASPAAFLHLLPGFALALLCMLLPAPALLLLPAAFAGTLTAAMQLHGQTQALPLRRYVPLSLLLAAITLAWCWLVTAVLAWPWAHLADQGSLAWALLLGLLMAGMLLAPWRFWLVPVLALLEAEHESSPRAALADAVQRSVELTRSAERYFGAGLPVALSLLGLAILPAWVMQMASDWPIASLAIAVSAYLLLVLPAAAWLMVDRVLEVLQNEADALEAAVLLAQQQADEAVARQLAEQQAFEAAQPQTGAALLAAARAGQVDRALALLAAGAPPDAAAECEDRDQRSALHAAILLPDLRLLRALIEAGADLTERCSGLAPLIMATRDSYQGRPDAVITLVTNGAALDCNDQDGNTPLHLSALSSSPAVAEILIDAGARLDAINYQGLTPLGVAFRGGRWEVAEYLLARGAQLVPEGAQPVVFAAVSCAEDDPTGVQLLAGRRKALDQRDTLQRTPLHVAALQGHAAICAALLAAGADVNARDAAQVTPLMEAARAGANAVLQVLLGARPDPASLDRRGRDALIIAASSRRADADTIRLLLAMGCRDNRRTNDGKTALECAVRRARWPLVAALDPNFELPTCLKPEGEAVDAAQPRQSSRLALLLRALEQQREAVALQLLALPPALAAEEWAEALYAAVRHDAQQVLAALMQAPTSPPWNLSQGPLLTALAGLAPLPAELLIDLLERCAPETRGALAAACGLAAARRAPLPPALLGALLRLGADPNASDDESRPWLLLAAAQGDTSSVHALLAAGARVDAEDAQGRNALRMALDAPAEASAVLKVLVAAGANPRQPAMDGTTPLGVALHRRRPEQLRWLRWPAWLQPVRSIDAACLIRAVVEDDADTCARLLELGVPVDACDSNGTTALLRAAALGHADRILQLIAAGADPDCGNRRGIRPLTAAILANRVAAVDALLKAGASPIADAMPSPLVLAAACFSPALVERLVRAGARPHIDATAQGPMQALVLALWSGARQVPAAETALALLRCGVDADASDAGGHPALLLLAGAHRPAADAADADLLAEVAVELARAGANLDIQDANLATPLHWAAHYGLVPLVKALAAAGARRSARDRLGRRPEDLAERSGHTELARWLAQPILPTVVSPVQRRVGA